MDYRLIGPFLYLAFIVRAIIVTKRKVATIGWMAASLVAAWVFALYGTVAVAHFTHATGDAAAAAADYFGIPAFIVPAVVGTLYARRTRRASVTKDDETVVSGRSR